MHQHPVDDVKVSYVISSALSLRVADENASIALFSMRNGKVHRVRILGHGFHERQYLII